MDSFFTYNKYVTGKNFIGRKTEATILANLLRGGENVVLYEPPKTGKMSLIQQALISMRLLGEQFRVAEFSLFNLRTEADFLIRFGSTVMKTYGNTPAEFSDMIRTHLLATHFYFDEEGFEQSERVLTIDVEPDENDIRAIAELPYRLSAQAGDVIYVIMREFQNIMQAGDGDMLCRRFEAALAGIPREGRKSCRLVFSGSCVNAMKDIFEFHGRFHRLVERVKVGPIEDKEIIEHVVKGFLSGGKVIDRDLLLGVCKLFKGNIWYINHFSAICDALSKGYIMEPVLVEALDRLISIHESRFMATMNDLTTFQVCLLKAIVDGHTKFSSAEVIKKYGLNSSANVRRLKDALCKKEIVTFNEHDEPEFLDPLFEYWVRRYWFELKVD